MIKHSKKFCMQGHFIGRFRFLYALLNCVTFMEIYFKYLWTIHCTHIYSAWEHLCVIFSPGLKFVKKKVKKKKLGRKKTFVTQMCLLQTFFLLQYFVTNKKFAYNFLVVTSKFSFTYIFLFKIYFLQFVSFLCKTIYIVLQFFLSQNIIVVKFFSLYIFFCHISFFTRQRDQLTTRHLELLRVNIVLLWAAKHYYIRLCTHEW